MINRPKYMDLLKKYKDTKLVKILAGIRRSGKSTILEMYAQYLKQIGIKDENIIIKKYTNLNESNEITSKQMYDEIKKRMTNNDKYYIILDEVQEITGWEKVVNSLSEFDNADVYVTGSNSKLMSREISTYLTGRYIEIPVYPLSFKEYLEAKKESNKNNRELFIDYLRLGGFPLTATYNFEDNSIYRIVEDIYSSVVLSDIKNRHNIQDEDMFARVVKFILENIGKTFSANSISTFMKSENRKVDVETIYNYLEWLEQAFIIYRCSRFDIQGKNILKTQEKFYIADQSIKYALLGYQPTSVASMLENIVYLELKRREYNVYIGKLFNKEIDFVAQKGNETIYIQVCRNLPEESDRELQNLMGIKDNYPKYVITMDDLAMGNVNGIKIMHIADFLLEE